MRQSLMMKDYRYLKEWEKQNKIQLAQLEMKEIQILQKFIFQQFKKMAR